MERHLLGRDVGGDHVLRPLAEAHVLSGQKVVQDGDELGALEIKPLQRQRQRLHRRCVPGGRVRARVRARARARARARVGARVRVRVRLPARSSTHTPSHTHIHTHTGQAGE